MHLDTVSIEAVVELSLMHRTQGHGLWTLLLLLYRSRPPEYACGAAAIAWSDGPMVNWLRRAVWKSKRF